MSLDAMRQALDALCDFDYDRRQSAITALRAAIEQAEMQGQSLSIKTWQERCEEHPDHNGIVTDRMIQARMQEEIDELRAAIKQAKKQRKWRGLTADEIWQCNTTPPGSEVGYHICMAHQNVLDFAEAIEAKLKEKNT